MAKCYLFDVDETLEVAGGPIGLMSIIDLRNAGHIIGLCGNFAVITRQVPNWHWVFSLVNIGVANKVDFMRGVKEYVPAEDYVMVGNGDGHTPNDAAAAAEAGWRFISEAAFAKGER